MERSIRMLRPIVCLLVLLGIGGWPVVSRAEKPNLVIIMVDDLGLDAIEGDHWPNQLQVHTPQLAHFARQGRSFTNVRMNPICSPSRASFLTGRQALRTGVVGVIGFEQPLPDRDLVSLQTNETTLAEILRDAGYHTILADKWHLGWGKSRGQFPTDQGFNVFIEGRELWVLDLPDEIGDEHITRLVDLAVAAVNERPVPEDPFAVFLWPKDPHKRVEDSKGFRWWMMDSKLQPSGEDYYSEPESDQKRFRGNVEALDTEIARFLTEIGVIDEKGDYRPESNTLVLFLGDNGTDERVSAFGENSKRTLYEGGIRVPCFAFGEGVPADGDADSRLISHVDFYDTLADYVGIPLEDRGSAPRDGVSFADALGAPVNPPKRRYVLSSEPHKDTQNHRVALVGDRYKLIARAGGTIGRVEEDEFYDLLEDPEEVHDLVAEGMNAQQIAVYAEMRDSIADFWNCAVLEPFQRNGTVDPDLLPYTVDIPVKRAKTILSDDTVLNDMLIVGYDVNPRSGALTEARTFCTFDLAPLWSLIVKMPEPPQRVTAQLVIEFRQDATGFWDADTPPLAVAAMMEDAFGPTANWDSLVDAHGPTTFGRFDPPPHVVLNPAGFLLRGVPMDRGTPVSFGRRENFITLLEDWLQEPESNFGLVIMAEGDPLPESGRQFIICEPQIALRVTVFDWN